MVLGGFGAGSMPYSPTLPCHTHCFTYQAPSLPPHPSLPSLHLQPPLFSLLLPLEFLILSSCCCCCPPPYPYPCFPQAILDYYSELRRLSRDRALPVTARSLETIIRLATASCKVGGGEEGTGGMGMGAVGVLEGVWERGAQVGGRVGTGTGVDVGRHPALTWRSEGKGRERRGGWRGVGSHNPHTTPAPSSNKKTAPSHINTPAQQHPRSKNTHHKNNPPAQKQPPRCACASRWMRATWRLLATSWTIA